VTAPEQALLLHRAYALRDFLDDREALTALVDRVVASATDPLVRAEAQRLRAQIDRHEGRIASALPPSRLAELVARAQQEWQSASPSDVPRRLEVLGRLELLTGSAGAHEHLEDAARREPTADRWLAVAESCADLCKAAALRNALATDPQSAAAKSALAAYYAARDQRERARDLYRDAIRLAPRDFVARKRLADVLLAAGLDENAARQYDALLREFPRPLWLKRELAGRYEVWGNLERARSVASDALHDDFDGTAERAILLRIAERTGDAAALEQNYRELAQLDPSASTPQLRLAQLDAAAGRSPLLQTRPTAMKSGAISDEEARYLVNVADVVAEAQQRLAASATVSLADVRVERLLATSAVITRVQQLVYMGNDEAARQFADRAVQYAPQSQALAVLHARIHKRDGRVLEGEPGGDTPVADAGVAMYYDLRARHVRFSGLERGDVVELDYRVTPLGTSGPYGDYFGELLLMRDELPQRFKRVVLLAPERVPLHISEVRMPQPAHIRALNGEREWMWELHDVAAAPREPRAPPLAELSPYLHISTFSSWGALGHWYASMIAPQFRLDAALREALAQVVAGKKTPLEKIAAIHEFVLRHTHYVALEFGVYSYKPYAATQVYARGYGDCKDKASLMIALLRAAGVPAQIALVRMRRLGAIDAGTPSLAIFNHAVVYVPNYDLWLDGTAEYAGQRELPLDDQGALALTVSAEGTAALRRIPASSALDNYSRRSVLARVESDGSVHFSGTAVTRGEDAPGLRRGYEVAERQLDFFRTRLADVLPSVKVDAVHVDGAKELDRAVSVEFRGVLDPRRGPHAVALTTSWLPQQYVHNLAPLTSRTQELLLPAPWTAEEEIRFVLPPNAELARVPRPARIETPFGSARVQYQRSGRDLTVRTFVQFRTVRIAPADYAAFRAFCAAVERALRDEIRIRVAG